MYTVEMAKKKSKNYKKSNLDKVITFRVNQNEYTKLKAMCKMYACGSMSVWLRHCVTNYTPKIITKKGPIVSHGPH